jgi:hypothetical protein
MKPIKNSYTFFAVIAIAVFLVQIARAQMSNAVDLRLTSRRQATVGMALAITLMTQTRSDYSASGGICESGTRSVDVKYWLDTLNAYAPASTNIVWSYEFHSFRAVREGTRLYIIGSAEPKSNWMYFTVIPRAVCEGVRDLSFASQEEYSRQHAR